MLSITFVPENNGFIAGACAYSRIWEEEGGRIITAIETAAGLKFKERSVTATVYEGISWSNPLKLRASYSEDTKKATLVHELLHRLSQEYLLTMPAKDEPFDLRQHKQIDLLLYDLWCGLYGKTFADQQVALESSRTPMYKAAWDWALCLSKAERCAKFAGLTAGARRQPSSALE